MKITYDPEKRARTLKERGLDFEDAREVFAGPVFEFEDLRRDYGERRMICYGLLRGRLVAVGYVERAGGRRAATLRQATDRDDARIGGRLARSGA
jgi:uncharacterized DUF497 family protein